MSKRKIKLGISPCPNDTFIFHALTHGKIDTGNFEFEVDHLDVEALNNKAAALEYDMVKLSYATLANELQNYQILRSGGALGKGVGPLLVAKEEMKEEEIDAATIAIPGKNTTANFLLSLAYPRAINKKELLFSDIEEAVLKEEADAGLLIHENRFTYQEKGLISLMDLGNYWEEVSSALIPLGGIAVKRDFSENVKSDLNRLLNESVEYAFKDPSASREYVKEYAQEMNDEVIDSHIQLYVNQYSLDVGEEGEKAVQLLFEKAKEKGLINDLIQPIFAA
jgi:1,4-dihydroxy-6-naphthoate synthase